MPNFNEEAKRAQQLPASLQFAIVTLAGNIMNGAFWGFTSYEEAKKYSEVLKADSNIIVRRIGKDDAVLVEVNPDYLLKAVAVSAPNLLDASDVKEMKEGIATAIAQMEKFLMSKADKNYKGYIGVYCINDTPTITYKGTAYPAFRINIQGALKALANWGYYVNVNNTFVTPQQASQSAGALFSSMNMSPTATGIFLQVQSTLNTEQLNALKAQRGFKK